MRQKVIPTELRTLFTKNKIDENDPLIQGFLKRYPKHDEEYHYFLTWGEDINDHISKLDLEIPNNNSIVDLTKFYFEDVFSIIGPQPFYALMHYPEIIENWVDGLAKDFLDDTYNYILTGRRKLSITVWESMLRQEVNDVKIYGRDYNFSPDRLVVCSNLGALKNLTPSEFYLRWIRSNEGAIDMVKSHQLLLQSY